MKAGREVRGYEGEEENMVVDSAFDRDSVELLEDENGVMRAMAFW